MKLFINGAGQSELSKLPYVKYDPALLFFIKYLAEMLIASSFHEEYQNFCYIFEKYSY